MTQKGFIKDRFIGDNTHLLYKLMHNLEEKNHEGLLLMIDIENAFDPIALYFLEKALESFNFGPSICKWFEISSCVINNGY